MRCIMILKAQPVYPVSAHTTGIQNKSSYAVIFIDTLITIMVRLWCALVDH